MNDALDLRFERNQYFTGKLLTAQDFKIEQKYLINKRRLLNRMMFGSGIVCGLQVIPVNDKVISIEAGLAIDSSGQEILLDSTITQNLSKISGFPETEYTGTLYLCIQYDEKEKDPAYSVESSGRGNEYNRIQEGYKLFLKNTPPDFSNYGLRSFLEDRKLLYEDKKIRIWNILPKFVNANEAFEACLRVEKLGGAERIKVEFQIDSEHFTLAGDDTDTVLFLEPEDATETEYAFKYSLQAKEACEGTGKIAIRQEKVKIRLGDREMDVHSGYSSKIKIIQGSVKEKILQSYLEQPLDLYVGQDEDRSVYIAKISIVQVMTGMGTTYSIEKVEKVSFEQYIYNASLLHLISEQKSNAKESAAWKEVMEQLQVLQESAKLEAAVVAEEAKPDTEPPVPLNQGSMVECKTGYVDILLGHIAKSGSRFFSDEIEHGLGVGQVSVTVGIEDVENSILDDLTKNKGIYFGDCDVFRGSPYDLAVPVASTGVITYPLKGTFRIGVLVKEQTKASRIRVRWWASMVKEPFATREKIEIAIDPEFVEVKMGESYTFQVVVKGTDKSKLDWVVNETGGGSVTQEGVYTAPEVKGVYSVTATSNEDPSKKATVYIIVK